MLLDLIERKGDAYTFKADGRDLPAAEVQPFAEEFGKGRKVRLEDLLPKAPVRLNEAWSPEPSALRDLAASLPVPVNPEKSKLTGKLTRVYARDGRQFIYK